MTTKRATAKKTATTQLALTSRPVRDRKGEDVAAKGRLAHRAAELRELRDAFDFEVTQVAQSLILCGLPYVRTTERQIVRTARLGDGSTVTVTFTAGLSRSEMPYGSDRTLLYFLLDKAVKADSRFVSWSTAVEFLSAMGMQTASGKNYSDLRQRFSRLRGLVIGVERSNAASETSELATIIRRSVLPTSIEVKAEKAGQQVLPLSAASPYGVEIEEGFFSELKRFHVPVPTELLVKTRKQSQLQDIVLFLHWRCYAARSASLIPWESLRDQLWHADKNERRIKQRVAEAIAFLKLLWPELQSEARKDGLWVAPPIKGKYLLPQGKAVRRLG